MSTPRPLQGTLSFNGLFSADGGDWKNASTFRFTESLWSFHSGDFTTIQTVGFPNNVPLTLAVPISNYCTFLDGQSNPQKQGAVDIKTLSLFRPPGLFFAEGQAVIHYTGFQNTLASWSIRAQPAPGPQPNLYFATAVINALGVHSILP